MSVCLSICLSVNLVCVWSLLCACMYICLSICLSGVCVCSCSCNECTHMQALHFIPTVCTVHSNELKGSTETSIQLLKHPLTVTSCDIVKINLFSCNMAKYSTRESTCECTCACSECTCACSECHVQSACGHSSAYTQGPKSNFRNLSSL